jgi:hypothetical protein
MYGVYIYVCVRVFFLRGVWYHQPVLYIYHLYHITWIHICNGWCLQYFTATFSYRHGPHVAAAPEAFAEMSGNWFHSQLDRIFCFTKKGHEKYTVQM